MTEKERFPLGDYLFVFNAGSSLTSNEEVTNLNDSHETTPESSQSEASDDLVDDGLESALGGE